MYIVAVPALLAHYDVLDSPGAPEQVANRSAADGFAHRGATSNNQLERRSLLFGYHPTTEYPILLDAELLREHMPDVVRQKQVVYFSLLGATDVGSVAQIAKLVVYSALSAAMAHRERYRERPKAYLVCDELARIFAGKNIGSS